MELKGIYEKFLCKFEPGKRKMRGSFYGKVIFLYKKNIFFNLWFFNNEN